MRTLSIPWRSLKTAPSCSISLAASPSPSRPQPQNLRLAAGCDGGAALAAEAAELGLIDEYRARVYPVLVGGGIPFFPQRGRRVNLELVENRAFSSSRVVYLRYRVAR